MRCRVVSSVLGLLVATWGCGGSAGVDSGEEAEASTSAATGDEGASTGGGGSSGASTDETRTGTSTTENPDTSSGTTAPSSDGVTGSSTGAPPCDPLQWCFDASEDGDCRREVLLPDGMRVYVWSNLPLHPAPPDAGCHALVERIIVVQHGNSRNPWSYFDSIVEAATIASAAETTFVLAPYFPADEDDPPAGFHRWEPGGSGWKSGDDSTTEPPMSSFAVYDHLLSSYALDAGLFPMVEDVVITGHSAGGQFTQRYAVATDVSGRGSSPGYRYVVSNPSSYLYLDPYRWDGLGTPPGLSFEIPSGTGCDTSYDDFKYGLSDLPAGHYVTDHLGDIPTAYLGRDVTYLLGEADTEIDSNLDTSCPADLQGANRYERGLVFADYLDVRFPAQSHLLATVPGVGHSQSGMYTSDVGVSVLFP